MKVTFCTFTGNFFKYLQHPFKAGQVLGRQAAVAGHAQDGAVRGVLLQADGRGGLGARAGRRADEGERVEEPMLELLPARDVGVGVLVEGGPSRRAADGVDQA